MNSKQRVFNAIKQKRPDMVPIALYESLIGAKMMKMDFSKVFSNGKLLAKSKLLVYEEFGQDIIDVESGIATEAEACGCLVEYPKDNLPWIKKPILNELEEVSKLVVPDPYKTRSMYTVLEAVNIISEKVGNEAFIIGEGDQGPFSLASQLRGIENFYFDLNFEENYRYINDLLRFCSEVFINYARALIKAGAHMTCMGESPAGSGLVSPDIYIRFAKPYEKEIIECLKKENILVANHICGWVDPIIEDMIETGADILEIDEKTNLKIAIEKSKGKCSILGAVPPAVIVFGKKEDIEESVINNLKIGMGSNGFILSPGCVLGSNTPLDDLEYFMECGRRYGRYSGA